MKIDGSVNWAFYRSFGAEDGRINDVLVWSDISVKVGSSLFIS